MGLFSYFNMGMLGHILLFQSKFRIASTWELSNAANALIVKTTSVGTIFYIYISRFRPF